MKWIVWTIAITAALSTATNAAEPQASSLKQGAETLARQMNSLCVDMHRTYKTMDEFAKAYGEAYELLTMAKEIEAAVASGASSEKITELLSDFDTEIHHVEHHIDEFNTALAGQNKAAQDTVLKEFEDVEGTLTSLLKQVGLNRKLAPGDGPVGSLPNAAQVVSAARDLKLKMNTFCVAMYKTYRDSDEFNKAYNEAYDLLQASIKIEETANSNGSIAKIKELLGDIRDELPHIEHHIEEFAEKKSQDKTGQDAVAKSVEDAEAALQLLMKQLGVSDEGADRHGHSDGAPKPGTKAKALATALRVALGSLCNEMDDRFKKNPDFKEAYRETYALYLDAEKIEKELTGDDVSDAVKELLKEFDGEIHHVEEHVKNFKADDTGSDKGKKLLNRKLDAVEASLHALMDRAGVKRKHVD